MMNVATVANMSRDRYGAVKSEPTSKAQASTVVSTKSLKWPSYSTVVFSNFVSLVCKYLHKVHKDFSQRTQRFETTHFTQLAYFLVFKRIIFNDYV